MTNIRTKLEARRAVEAMRAGVPSGAAVRSLGSGQDHLEQRFRQLLDQSNTLYGDQRQASGLLFRAGFGEGKSHLLTCFEHEALDRGYAVSRVVISKETPLNAPARILASVAENLRLPGRVGRGVREIGVPLRAQFGSAHYMRLVELLQEEGGLDQRFSATLQAFEVGGEQDEELGDKILRFWSGEKLNLPDLKRYLRELDLLAGFRLSAVRDRDLALQTMTFLSHLVVASGHHGLVLLIDEVELVGRYARLGRAQSYAELSRWMGACSHDQRPGLITVAAVTSDYDEAILVGRSDLELAPQLLLTRDPVASIASREGMRLIRSSLRLTVPTQEYLRQSFEKLQQLHAEAYDWEPPDDVTWPESLGATPMRTYVRAWINGWDVRRLYPDQRMDSAGYQIDQVVSSYVEDPSYATDPADSSSEDD